MARRVDLRFMVEVLVGMHKKVGVANTLLWMIWLLFMRVEKKQFPVASHDGGGT